jgi:hypothetical protein
LGISGTCRQNDQQGPYKKRQSDIQDLSLS